MKITIRLDEALLRQTKKLALETGRTLTAVIEDALREVLARRKDVKTYTKVRFTTFGGSGLRLGVDLDSSAALLELMESADDSH